MVWTVKRTTMRDKDGVLRDDYALFGTANGRPVALRLEWVAPERRRAVADRLAERLNATPDTVQVRALRVDEVASAEAQPPA